MVSPLVDLVFNLMITMFVFLMIYMLLVIPEDIDPLFFAWTKLPAAKVHGEYQTNIPIAGGTGHYFAMFIEGRGSPALVRDPDSELMVPAPAQCWPADTTDAAEPHEQDKAYLDRQGVGLLELELYSGHLQGVLLPGSLGLNGSTGAFEFTLVAVDRKVRTACTDELVLNPKRPHLWVPATLFDVSRGKCEPIGCYDTIGHRFSIPVKPKEIPFDPNEHPLRLVNGGDLEAEAVVGIPFSLTLALQGGIEPYEFTWISNVPEWLFLNPATGRLSGTPTRAGAVDIVVAVKDSQTPAGNWAMARRLGDEPSRPYLEIGLRLTVKPYEPLTAEIVVPDYGRVDEAIKGAVVVNGGYGRRRFTPTALPEGLMLDVETGLITGAPGATGDFRLSATVTDEHPDPAKATAVAEWPEDWLVIPQRPSASIAGEIAP